MGKATFIDFGDFKDSDVNKFKDGDEVIFQFSPILPANHGSIQHDGPSIAIVSEKTGSICKFIRYYDGTTGNDLNKYRFIIENDPLEWKSLGWEVSPEELKVGDIVTYTDAVIVERRGGTVVSAGEHLEVHDDKHGYRTPLIYSDGSLRSAVRNLKRIKTAEEVAAEELKQMIDDAMDEVRRRIEKSSYSDPVCKFTFKDGSVKYRPAWVSPETQLLRTSIDCKNSVNVSEIEDLVKVVVMP